MMRSEPVPPDCAMTAGMAPGIMAARQACALDEEPAHRGETIRRELSRLTALLRRHFSQGGAESLLPVLADTSNPAAAEGARAFLAQIRGLAEALEADARQWSASERTAGAFADFRREALALLAGVEERLGGGDYQVERRITTD
jgi:hypothetical protein